MNKQYYFWVSSTFILLAIISVFAGFTAKGIDFTAFAPWLSIKCALALSLMVLFVQLPAIIIMFINKKCSKNPE
ncbi:TPA: hypothetical protein ACH9CF_001037 [Streptococcus pneumoniae]|uniref:hypothetical protein n=1 Tax=Streptococcus pneumoniae TaxID=1313 RepID=UPI00076516A4|nr:hypothetical protein [Streptococcus pneumoniae]MBW8111300.1 hypothetical protein [Streptococcus pneumoniae]OBX93435.1 hypothetical protein AX278_05840 [Streptococcus pneumoniae]CVO40967.1 Uncharacterised protein [Streptococcus pneumoniae]CVR86349.1 Uncharacterised protein [Streptococcus pneumoniae]CVV14865.1 Uncharacterised protein [Streptococcus pneumoniae]